MSVAEALLTGVGAFPDFFAVVGGGAADVDVSVAAGVLCVAVVSVAALDFRFFFDFVVDVVSVDCAVACATALATLKPKKTSAALAIILK